MNSLNKLLLIYLIGFSGSEVYSQKNDTVTTPSYLSFQSGAFIDGYNSMGVRAFFEYQKDLKKNWQYGISFEQTVHLYPAGQDFPNTLPASNTMLCYNHYYKLRLYKDRVFWTAGLGAGLVNVNWSGHNKIGPVVTGSFTLNIRITKRIFIETSPLIVLLPSNRGYYSPINVSGIPDFYGGSFFPIGFKVKL